MKFTPAKDILDHAENQRERLAVQLFDADNIAQQIKAASDQGLFYLRISQDKPIDLGSTKYAQGLVKKLRKAGFKIDWVETSLRELSGNRPTDAVFIFKELCISWGVTPRRGGQQANLGC